MKTNTKIILAALVVLIVMAVPLYYYTRPVTPQESALAISGQVNNPTTLSFSQLEAYTPLTVQVTLSSSSKSADNGSFNYTGVPLKDLLNQAQVSNNATSVFIQASDGYGTTISLQDAVNQTTIIAYQKDGAPLAAIKNGGEGPLRLIISSDQYAQRWIRGVVAIEVS